MPVIIKNGKTYGDRSVTLSKAEYDALSSAEKLNGTVYYIYDSNENMGINVELTQAQYDALVDPDPDTVYYITDGTVSYPTADDMRYQEGVSVADALDALNSGLIPQTLTPTKASPISNANVYAKRSGNVVSVAIDTTSTVSIPQSTSTLLLSGLPKNACRLSDGVITLDVTSTYSRVWVDSSGNVYTFVSPAYSGGLFVSLTYITSD